MLCNFIYIGKDEKGDYYICEKCTYRTRHQNTHRECRPQIQKQFGEPSLLGKIGHLTYAAAKHMYKGMPTVSQEQLNERLKICQECPLLKKVGLVGGVCTHESCGCTIKDEITFLNKIAWADQECPIGKWGKIDENGV